MRYTRNVPGFDNGLSRAGSGDTRGPSPQADTRTRTSNVDRFTCLQLHTRVCMFKHVFPCDANITDRGDRGAGGCTCVCTVHMCTIPCVHVCLCV